MVYDLEKAHALKLQARKQLDKIDKLIEIKIDKYQDMELPKWIEIEGHSILVTSGDGIRIYDRILSDRQKRRPTWGYILLKYEVIHIRTGWGSLTVDQLPWALKVLKYICGSFVIQKPDDDPDYVKAINKLFNEVSDMNKAVRELRRL